MPRRLYDCHAKERGDLCGGDDCRTCHPENFDDEGRYLWAECESCGDTFMKRHIDDEDVCLRCVQRAEEFEEEQPAQGNQQ